ncbi:hypothetical protein BASA83_008243 [Batrachochytrium salamandrivorans]|nr:hypothetical protein BASA83_008243 [Batrachochytrium salamandrivorans]
MLRTLHRKGLQLWSSWCIQSTGIRKGDEPRLRSSPIHFYHRDQIPGIIISSSGVSMNPSKIKACKNGQLQEKILSQYDENEVLRPIGVLARQMNSAERTTRSMTKNLLAVVESFKHWRHFLQGGLHAVTVLCDHKNLEYFHVNKKVNSASSPLVSRSSEYDFTITHRSGKLNGRADPLSRRHTTIRE